MEKYSRKKIIEAWEILKDIKNYSEEKEKEARKRLSFFREIHIKPMNNFRILLGEKCKKIGINKALISQRLKRLPSIVRKLQNNKDMKLSTMQDVWWVRVVVDNIEDVKNLEKEMKRIEKSRSFKSELKYENNHIKTTKESWYRSLHLIYHYNKNIQEWERCRIEIQIRTKIQHAWATAVEVMGIFLGQALKQSQWDNTILELFKDISLLFEKSEKKENLDDDFIRKLNKKVKDMRLTEILIPFNISLDNSKKYLEHKEFAFLLIILDIENKEISTEWFSKKRKEEANLRYSELEKELEWQNKEIVLISVSEIKKLRELYPNYFWDTNTFVSILEELLERNYN